ncbi:MAG: glycosyltransferase family 39 protein [Ktedonobacteraceae bacterium]|nr:glycosyltransferase family 39 protein [Ktedonobacteraceae bacterium]
MKRWQPFIPAISIFCLALLVRVIYNGTVAHDYQPSHDSLVYQSIALNLLQGHCFCIYPHIPTVDRAPLWPALIALIYGLFGPHDYFVRLFLCGIGAGTCLLLSLFARDLFGQRMGMLAGVIAALYPELYIYDGWLYSESIYIFLLFALCYSLYRLQRASQRPLWAWIACGVLLALVAFVRPTGLLIIGIVMLWALFIAHTQRIPWPSILKGAGATLLVSLALIAPWTLRNYLVSGGFVPIATGEGTVLLGAYNDQILVKPHYIGTWISPPTVNRPLASHYPAECSATCQVAREADFKSHAEQWVGEHISSMPFLLWTHFSNIWQPATQEADLPTGRFSTLPATQIVLAMMNTVPLCIFALAAGGLVATRKSRRELTFIYLVILVTIAQCLVFYGSARFRAPLEPMLILFATGAICWLASRGKRTRLDDPPVLKTNKSPALPRGTRSQKEE